MAAAIHVYFKFGKGNELFDDWMKSNKKNIHNNPEIDLSIFFGDWKVLGKEEYVRKHVRNRKQVDLFFSLRGTVYFWIFYGAHVYCFIGKNLDVKDGDNIDIKNQDYRSPKSISAKLHKVFERINHLAFFMNINTDRTYNLKTIVEFEDDAVKGYAQKLVDWSMGLPQEKIRIDKSNFIDYLSPIEFETLVFLLFTDFKNKTQFCSAFRGGTLKDYDLKIKPFKAGILKGINEIKGDDESSMWVQVKKKVEDADRVKGIWLVCAQDSCLDATKKIIGKRWIIQKVDENEFIKEWLRNSVFDDKYVNFEWDSDPAK